MTYAHAILAESPTLHEIHCDWPSETVCMINNELEVNGPVTFDFTAGQWHDALDFEWNMVGYSVPRIHVFDRH